MQTSLPRRTLPKLIVLAIAVLALGFFLFQDTGTSSAACTGCPSQYQAETHQSVSSKTANAVADLHVVLDIPVGSLNFYGINFNQPPNATVCPGPGGPGPSGLCTTPVLGDIVGTLLSDPTSLGLANGACSSSIPVDFTLMNATVDTSAGNQMAPTSAADSGPVPKDPVGNVSGTLTPYMLDVPPASGNGHPASGTGIDNDLPSGVDRYPTFLLTMFPGVPPRARYFGANIVGGNAVTLNFVVFAPGALGSIPAPNPSHDMGLTDLGYSSITVLNDPTAPAAPGGVTDFCTPLATASTIFGTTKDNPCTDLPGPEADPDTCGANDDHINAALYLPTPGASTGRVQYANPPAGTRLYTTLHISQRDLDGDGYENGFDTCPYTNSAPFNPRVGPPVGDTDSDFIDNSCDAVQNGGSNEDGDIHPNGSEWLNAGDNCPQVGNPLNEEQEVNESDTVSRPRGGSEGDSIGDACDLAETSCNDAVDNDADTLVNDGCPAQAAAEVGCLNSVDDDNDGKVNDGCPSSSRVANGKYYATFTVDAICIGGTDADNDGWCNSATSAGGGFTRNLPADPDDGNAAKTPEVYAATFPFPIVHSGAGNGPADRWPAQVCNDGVDNDGDGATDLLDSGCKPASFLATSDTDGDGYNDETEIHVGTDALGRCEVKGAAVPSGDWPADLNGNNDKIDISDVLSFVAPTNRIGATPSSPAYNRRWDLVSDAAINVTDLLNLVTFTAPMPPFNGAKPYGGAACTADPFFND